MADDPEPRSGGNGFSALMSQKVFGVPLPVVGGAVLALALIAYRLFGAKSSSGNPATSGTGTQFSSTTTRTDPTTGVSTSYTAQGNGYLPGMLSYQAGPMPYQGGDVYVNYPAASNTDSTQPTTNPVNPNDIDDPKVYGRSEIELIQSLVGKGEYTQQIVDDVKAAYDAEAAHYGQKYADLQHYSYVGPGNVQAIPRHLTAAEQVTTGLPNHPKWGQYYGNVFNETSPNEGQGY